MELSVAADSMKQVDILMLSFFLSISTMNFSVYIMQIKSFYVTFYRNHVGKNIKINTRTPR